MSKQRIPAETVGTYTKQFADTCKEAGTLLVPFNLNLTESEVIWYHARPLIVGNLWE